MQNLEVFVMYYNNRPFIVSVIFLAEPTNWKYKNVDLFSATQYDLQVHDI